MPFRITVDPAKRRATLRLSGTVALPMLANVSEALYREPAWQPGFDVLWDCRAIRTLLMEKDDLATIATHAASHLYQSGTGRRALVATRDLDLMVAKLVFARIQGDGQRRRIFQHMDDALAWLDTPDEGA